MHTLHVCLVAVAFVAVFVAAAEDPADGCEVKGAVFTPCGPACVATCANPFPVCTKPCEPGCHCPAQTVLRGNACVPVSECVTATCTKDADCLDADWCTSNKCDLQKKTCYIEEVAGCCHSDSQCNDDDPCTKDECNYNSAFRQCTHTYTCCKADSDCNDNNACTEDSCTGGKCTSKYIDGCFLVASVARSSDQDSHSTSAGGLPATAYIAIAVGVVAVSVIVALVVNTRRNAAATTSVVSLEPTTPTVALSSEV